MAIYTVDTIADRVAAGDGVLSLREALALADADPGADTILFADAVQGRTIVLAGSQLSVASDVTIDGGAGVTLDADERSRVLLVEGEGADDRNNVTLAHLTVSGGRTTGRYEGGAGIRADGYATLTLDHATVSANGTTGRDARGGGIFGFEVTLTDSTVGGNSTAGRNGFGGGTSANYVTLTNSTISGNSTRGESASGGGISGSDVTLIDSTVSGNRTAGDRAYGGGISGSDVTLTNSTVSGNRTTGDFAGGGGIHGSYGSTIRLTNSTLSGNETEGKNAGGGGIYGYGPSSYIIGNSIVAGNTSSGSPSDVGFVTASNGLNIFGSEVYGNLPSDRENVPVSTLFAGGLADNGGPTQTIALRDSPNNPALGRADPDLAPATDQRGTARPQPTDGNPDIGAFELGESAPSPLPVGTTFIVTTTSDVTTDDDVLTLREALALANADSLTRDRIAFAPDVQGQRIVLSGSQLTVTSDVTVDGGAGVTIDANQASRALLVRGFSDFVMEHLTITGGRGERTQFVDGGGGIRSDSEAAITLDHCTVVGNAMVDGYGGGVFGYDVTLTNSTVTGNYSSRSGGGVGGGYGSSVRLNNSTISGNVAQFGAGLNVGSESTLALSHCTVAGNNATSSYGDASGVNVGRFGLFLVDNSIVADSVITTDFQGLAATTVSNGHNIFGGDIVGDVPGDLENVPASLLFAGGLADNGGPTQTIALRDAPDNPALGRADPGSPLATDQRGFARPLPAGSNPDIGAFELDQRPPANVSIGTSQDDMLRGSAGADVISGRAGNDRLWGLDGDDELQSGFGDDVLTGGPGIDLMTGGPGADLFIFRQLGAAPPVGPMFDEVLDFSRGEHDRIDLRPLDARGGLPGDEAFVFIGRPVFTRAGQLRFEATADGDFLVSGNVDRDLAADFAFMVRTDLASLKASDFLL